MSEIKIEKGVALPDKKASRRRIYPWLDMEVGDSFLFPAGTKLNVAACAVYSATMRGDGRKYVARKTREGYRCWRVA